MEFSPLLFCGFRKIARCATPAGVGLMEIRAPRVEGARRVQALPGQSVIQSANKRWRDPFYDYLWIDGREGLRFFLSCLTLLRIHGLTGDGLSFFNLRRSIRA